MYAPAVFQNRTLETRELRSTGVSIRTTCALEREQLEAVALQKITQDQDERPGLSGTTRAGAGLPVARRGSNPGTRGL